MEGPLCHDIQVRPYSVRYSSEIGNLRVFPRKLRPLTDVHYMQ